MHRIISMKSNMVLSSGTEKELCALAAVFISTY